MKNKASKFKNPFDLMEEDEDTVSFTKHTYVEQVTTIQTPFDPYNISSQPINSPPPIVHLPPQNLSKSQPSPNGFNPYQQQASSSTNIGGSQGYNNPVPPSREYKQYAPEKTYELNDDGDPPLLEDIGIEPEKIKERILSVVKLSKPDEEMMDDPDLSGPILIALCFGCLLLFSGKIQFGDIYAVFIFGNILLYVFFNFMSQGQILPFYNIMSTMGYGLLPMLILGAMGIVLPLNGLTGIVFGMALAGWSSIAAGNIMEALMKEPQKNRRALIVYPIFLFYVSFAMIVMF